VAAYRRLKTKENFKRFAPKQVAVAYERWSLTGNFWYFGKLVTEERWLQPDVRCTCQNNVESASQLHVEVEN